MSVRVNKWEGGCVRTGRWLVGIRGELGSKYEDD